MYIRRIKPVENSLNLFNELNARLDKSRFFADTTGSRRGWIKIVNVRLRYKKAYCGSHGRECVLPHDGPHKKMTYLEGADWVEFNDLVNDVCDELGISANISSVVCVIREGYCRRTEYDTVNSEPGKGWQRAGFMENWIDRQAPASDFPTGTPGAYKSIYFCEG